MLFRSKLYFPATPEHTQEIKQLTMKSEENMLKIPSFNFGETIIYGENADSAAQYLLNQSNLSMSEEMLLHQKVKNLFNVSINVTNKHSKN